MNLTSEQLERCKERLPIFKTAADKYSWPDELKAVMVPSLGPDWAEWVLAGINARESRFGALLDANGLGDGGHGHGEMQIDDRSHPAFCASGKWKDLSASLEYVHANVIVPAFNTIGNYGEYFDDGKGAIDYAKLFWAAIAAYNCGVGNVLKALAAGDDPDSRTTGRNFSADVNATATALYATFAGLPKPTPTSLPHDVGKADEYGIDFPILQSDLLDIFGEPDESGPFTEGYVRFCDLAVFRNDLAHVKGLSLKDGRFGFNCNYVMIPALQQAVRQVVTAGLAHELISFDGCHCVRAMKSNSGSLSVHAWALALDWNALQNPFTYGALVNRWSPEFIQAWLKAGFEWGGAWSSCHDAMHFQFALTRSLESWKAAKTLWLPSIPYSQGN